MLHAAGDKHKRNFAIMMKTPAINSFFGKSSNKAKPVTLSSSEPSQNQSVVMHDPPVAVQHVEPNRVTLKDFGFKNGLFKSDISGPYAPLMHIYPTVSQKSYPRLLS